MIWTCVPMSLIMMTIGLYVFGTMVNLLRVSLLINKFVSCRLLCLC